MKLPLATQGPAPQSPPRPGQERPQRRPQRRATAAPATQADAPRSTRSRAPPRVVGWLDERTGASPFLRGFLFRKVPKGTNWFYTLGSATMFAFLSQAVTGVFLAMYYEPDAVARLRVGVRTSPTRSSSASSCAACTRWGSTVMIILIFLHMGRTFFFGAYKYPRELNWIIGVVLLVLTLMMGLTGYLLPFDQRSFWATVVAREHQRSGPIVGPYLADFLRGGRRVRRRPRSAASTRCTCC